MICDSHVHLDDEKLRGFLESYSNFQEDSPRLNVISNSVDAHSSQVNLDLGRSLKGVSAFVGIHPQVLFQQGKQIATESTVELEIALINKMLAEASGLGEIGLDPIYGDLRIQEIVFTRLLELAEKNSLPVATHSRQSIDRCLEIMSTFELKGGVMFHWFAGTQSDMSVLHGKGMYTSFGPSLLYSKRIQKLICSSDKSLLLAETDSPLRLDSIHHGMITTPLFVTSVIFKAALMLGRTFNETERLIEENTLNFLDGRKTH
jgi:TatD DNase family protein